MDPIGVPECCVCLQQYDEGERIPHVLNCGHTLCITCAVELPTQWGESSSGPSLSGSSRAPGSVIRCPECNHRTKLPFGGPSGLPKNIELMRVVNTIQRWLDAHSSRGKEGVAVETQTETANMDIANPAGRRIGIEAHAHANGNGRHVAVLTETNVELVRKIGKTVQDVKNARRDRARRSRADRQNGLTEMMTRLGGIRGLGSSHLEVDDDVVQLGERDEEMSDVQDSSQDDEEDAAASETSSWPCLVELKTLEGHFDAVSALTVFGPYLLSGGYDKTVRVWSLRDGTLLHTFEGHGHKIMALAVDHESKVCFSGDYGGQIFVWNLVHLSASKPLVTWQEHNDWRYTGVACLAASTVTTSGSGNRAIKGILYSGSGDRTIKAWSLQDYSLLTTMEGHKALVSALLIDGEVLYSGSWDGTVRLWWRGDHSPLACIGGSDVVTLGSVRSLSGKGGLVFVARDNGVLQVWRDEEYLGSVDAHTGTVSTLCVGGNWLYTGSWDKSLKAWQLHPSLLDSGPEIVSIGATQVTALAAHSGRLYGGFGDGTIKVFREAQHPRELQNECEIFHCSA